MTRYRVAKQNNGIFPLYEDESAEFLCTEQKLNLAKMIATRLFEVGEAEAQRVFRNYCVRKYRCKRHNVKFKPRRQSLRRIRSAILNSEIPELLGQTDGDTIEVSSNTLMTFTDLVGVLVHEALHNWCHVYGRVLSGTVEHHCMAVLGDVHCYF